MQTVVQITCTRGESLRQRIEDDTLFLLENYDFEILREKKSGVKPGWTKVRSKNSDYRGVINIDWNPGTKLLTCRVVNKGKGRPDQTIGAFIGYILERYKRRLKHISIWTV